MQPRDTRSSAPTCPGQAHRKRSKVKRIREGGGLFLPPGLTIPGIFSSVGVTFASAHCRLVELSIPCRCSLSKYTRPLFSLIISSHIFLLFFILFFFFSILSPLLASFYSLLSSSSSFPSILFPSFVCLLSLLSLLPLPLPHFPPLLSHFLFPKNSIPSSSFPPQGLSSPRFTSHPRDSFFLTAFPHFFFFFLLFLLLFFSSLSSFKFTFSYLQC